MARRIEQVFDEAAQLNPTGGDKKVFMWKTFCTPRKTENNMFTNCNPLLTHRVVAYKT